MNIAIPIKMFNINNVFYQEAIKNTIMTDSNFIRIIYSDELCMLNGICLEFTLPIIYIDKSFNKFKCTFEKQLSGETIQAICKAEYDILTKYNKSIGKTPIYRINDQLKNGIIKVVSINNTGNNMTPYKTFTIKISGIWSNETEYGLTYKFTHCGLSL